MLKIFLTTQDLPNELMNYLITNLFIAQLRLHSENTLWDSTLNMLQIDIPGNTE